MMKRIFYSLVFLLFAVLSSCVTKDISIVKRKYSSGYYVNLSNHKNNTATPKVKHNSAVNVSNNKFNSQSAIRAIDVPIEVIASHLLNESNQEIRTQNYTASKSKVEHIKSSIQKGQSIQSSYIVKNKEVHQNIKSIVDKNNINDRKIQALLKSRNKTNTELFVLVILSLIPILALVAMYLKDGEEITLNFWVDLILHLTIVGYLIFALLVVFDIINLA